MRYLTAAELLMACMKHNYLLLRCEQSVQAINCKAAFIAIKQHGFDPEVETIFTGYIPCGFQEYITYKAPFV